MIISRVIFGILSLLIDCQAQPENNLLLKFKEEICKKIGTDAFEISLPKDEKLKSGETFKIETINLSEDQKYFIANCSDEQENKNYEIKGKFTWVVKVPVLKTPLLKGEIIKKDNIILKELPSNLIDETIITQQEDLIGLEAKVMLPNALIPLKKTFLTEPILIKKGAIAQITYKSPTLEITTSAIAKTPGRKGEIILFEKISKEKIKKTIQARVVDFEKAEIQRAQ